MKIDTKDVPVEFGGTKAQGEFHIKNSATAFSILSSGLYSNKFRAILRELGCNAYDSHVEAGSPEKPFTVHLPTKINPVLSVRDYGVGLNHDEVMNLYTTYFESTKSNSNDFVGCMGLGSKSPFSYTKNFTITAIKNGTKGVYSAFIGDQGVPSIVQMLSEDTDEFNGVEVSFAVNSSQDMRSFEHEAIEVFAWFAVKPEITGNHVTIPELKYAEENILPGVHLRSNNGYSNYSSYAIMGNVAYPIRFPCGIEIPDKIRKLYSNNRFVVRFDIGELDIAASREELSYIPSTIEALVAKGEQIVDALATHIERKLETAKNAWERTLLLAEICSENPNLFDTPAGRYIEKNPRKFVKGAQRARYSSIEIQVPTEELNAVEGLRWTAKDVAMRYSRDGNKVILQTCGTQRVFKPKHLHKKPSKTLTDIEAYGLNQWPAVLILPRRSIIIFNDDGGNNILARIRQAALDPNYTARLKDHQLLIFGAKNKSVDKAPLLKFVKQRFAGAPILFASELPELERGVVTSDPKIKVNYFEPHHGRLRDTCVLGTVTQDMKLLEPTLEKDQKKTYLYLRLHGRSIMLPNDNKVSADVMWNRMQDAHIQRLFDINPRNVYGVNKTSFEAVTKAANWVDFFDYISEAYEKIDWKKARAETQLKILAATFQAEELYPGNANEEEVKAIAKTQTPAGKMFQHWLELEPSLTTLPDAKLYDHLVRIMTKWFPEKDVPDLKAKLKLEQIEAEYAELFRNLKTTYPLLEYLPLSQQRYYTRNREPGPGWRKAIDYIKLVDSTL